MNILLKLSEEPILKSKEQRSLKSLGIIQIELVSETGSNTYFERVNRVGKIYIYAYRISSIYVKYTSVISLQGTRRCRLD